MKTYFSRICFAVFIITIMAPGSLNAACQIVGTTINGYIVVCDGTDTIGVISGNGNDLITVEPGAEVSKTDLQSTDSTASSSATTVDARRGNDQMVNTGTIRAHAGMTINAEDFVATPLGNKEINASVLGEATAVGVDGGSGNRRDKVTNNGTIDVTATSNVTGGQFQLDLLDVTKADATLTANATATGIKGIRNNEIVNNGSITATSGASVTGWTGEVNVLDQATANTTITPNAASTGIAGGNGYDRITNTGAVSVTANSEAFLWFGEFNVVDLAVLGAGVGSAEDPMKSGVTGIKTANGGSEIANQATGTITADAHSTANIASVILTLYDFTVAADISESAGSTATHVRAVAVGISGGRGRDVIHNDGEIKATATSLVTSEGVGIGAEGVSSGILPALKPDIPAADATLTASAQAIGIEVGAGKDDIINTGKITAVAEATTGSGSLSVSFPLLELTGVLDWKLVKNLPWLIDYPPAIAIASGGTQAAADAWGIQAGDGNDRISNEGYPEAVIDVDSTSLATTTGVSVVLQNVKTGSSSFPFLNLDVALANTTTKAESTATGIDAGSGHDSVGNEGTLTVTSDATAIGNAASVTVEGLKGMEGFGLAIVRTKIGTEATATAEGVTGGQGNDKIHNTGKMDVDAHSIANSFTANVSVQGATKTLGAGVAFADATTTSSATAAGISGGDGKDEILSGAGSSGGPGSLHVYATSEAYSESFSVAVQKEMEVEKGKKSAFLGSKGLQIGGALALGTTTATATATGMDGGTGNNTFLNQGFTDIRADATANTLGAVVDVQASVKGLGAGVAFIDTTTSTTADAIGISGGDHKDFITNSATGTIKAHADSNTYAEEFAVTVQGESTGVELGGALALGSTTATAAATGIDGGKGRDEFHNAGMVDVNGNATTNNLAAAVDIQSSVKGVGLGVAFTDISSTGTSTATGISVGEGGGMIQNSATGTIKAYADSNTYAEAFAVTVQGESTGLELGGALALGSTTATATATGISGGKGREEILNAGMVDVRGDGTTNNLAVAVDVQSSVNGVGLGVAFTDVSSAATTAATGISSSAGGDTIQNSATGTIKAYAESDAYAEVLSVDVQGKGTGIMIGGALALAGSTATATATGVDGGAGKDAILNQGLTDANATSTGNSLAIAVTVQGKVDGFGGSASLTDTSTSSTATTTGISGGEGTDRIINSVGATVKSHATAEAYAESVSPTIQGYGTGVTMAGSLARGVTTPTASSVGISGGEGDDTLVNQGLTDVKASTDSTSVAVSVRVVGLIEGISVGASATDTSTTANATAVGLEGGLGNDVLYNSGTLQANTDSTVRSASVSFDFGGVPIGVSVGAALASASTHATDTSMGISGGKGNDDITNAVGSLIDVDSTANATSTAVSISANVIGAAWTNTSATTLTQATGIAGGEGKDGIANLGKVDVDSSSTANVANVTVNLIGATPVSGWTSSTANAAGIDAGLGDDWVQNEGAVTADSISTTDATGVTVQIAGYSDMDVNTNAAANATGMIGGDGVNTIYNTGTGSIEATATTYGDTTAVNINLLGYSKTDGSSTGEATAVGILGGKEADIIQNDGTVNSTATSDMDASSTGVQLVGYGESNAKGTSNATVKGIDGSDGVNTLINTGSITGTATALADASSYNIQLSGGAKATAGTEATATTIGIAGGKDRDAIRNEGAINLAAQSTLVSESRSFEIFGAGFADADSTAQAVAIGIDGSEGTNTIANTSTGSITVSSNASATATGLTANIGIAGSSANTTSNAHSVGIKSGGGQDTILNEGILNVNATSSTYAGSGGLSLIGLSFGAAITEAITDGIVAGDGKDVIINKGTITVGAVVDNDHPMAYSNVDSVSMSLFNISSATFGSKAQATGIIGGKGDDTLLNAGTITVGDENWMAKGGAYGFSGQFIDFFTLTSVGATAETVSTGIEGGDGNDTLLNDNTGGLTVQATSYARTEGAADVTTFGSPAAFASSTTKATATGISGGEGDDVIENRGAIDVSAHTLAEAYSDSWVGWGSPKADSTADATATAVGIHAGEGQNFVTNSGLMNVSALAETRPYAKADSDVDRTDAEATAYSKSTAVGVLAGDGDNILNNTATGEIIVTATAKTSDAQDNVAKADSDEEATVIARPASNAVGIQAGKGNNLIFNDGQITVGSEVNSNSHASASSTLYTATATTKTGGSADATGIKVGDGNNTIKNVGTVTVTATNEGVALSNYHSAHLDNGYAYAGGGDTSLTSNATGISAGNGVNIIENYDSIIVSSTVDADAQAYTNTATTTTHAKAYAGGNATAIGIFAANGQNTIKNYGNVAVSATADAYALGHAEEYGSAYIGSENSPGIIAEAVGISAGHGVNEISNYGTLEVNATATANSQAAGDEATITVANSYATATGIRAGDGTNSVANFGAMNIVSSGLDSSAFGIRTGAGDDIVANYGTISATNMRNGISSLGTAITSGAGSDQVFLMDGSTTTGSIDLGDGDDRLAFVGAPIVSGNVTGAAGIDTLVFDGTGSIGFTPTAFEHAIKQGTGTYSVASLPTMERIEIKQGVLEVNNYQFSDSGSFQTIVNGDGSFGQLKINGTTELAGDLSVLKGPGHFRNGATYKIIEAAGGPGVSGTFGDILLPETKPLLRFDVHQLPNAVDVEVRARRFTTVATNRVERTLASYLDRVAPTATGDLSNVLGEFQSLSSSEFGTAFSSLSPGSYDHYTRATYDSAWHYTGSLQRRLNNIRTYGTAGGYDPESKPLLLAFAGSDASLGQLFATGQVSQTQAKNGLWFNGYGQWGDQEPDKGFTGFDYNLYGGTLGFDHTFGDKLIAGLSLGYSRADVELDHDRGDGYIKTFTGSLYGSYFTKSVYVEGAASYGRNWYDNHRLVTVGPIVRRVSSDHDGNLFSGYLGAGYTFDVKKWLIGPFGTLRYVYLDEESFEERGAGAVSLQIDDRQTDALVSELGIRLARVFKTECGSLIPEVSAAWLYDFDIDDRVITSSLAGSPGASFSMEGQDVERNGATLGAAITFIHKSGFSTSLKYRGEFREKYKSNGVMGELRFMF